ncbi:MAG: bifunctional 2-C-methyl-D-erythritol 4-phosphate cytidylyltransferase/2-C-methyl-D-erythritol 2,4-cyclodiphosphate synthase [Rhizobiaceae bacterium]
MASSGEIAVIILAAGRGERAGLEAGPKQYRSIGGMAVIRRTVDAIRQHNPSGRIILVIHADDRGLALQALGQMHEDVTIVIGGHTRQSSTLQGLHALAASPPDHVMIHDGVRPFVDKNLFDRLAGALTMRHGAIPAMPVTESLKKSEAGLVTGAVERAGLFAAQTPQGFPFSAIYEAHSRAAGAGLSCFTDDAAIAEWAGLKVKLVEGAPENIKLTWKRDIDLADQRMRQNTDYPDVRTGNGYDVHSFVTGDHVTLCGVRIPHEAGLNGHSDSDVALHALTDALLATCGAGDIGTHFPPSDPQWKGAASSIFVSHAAGIIRSNKGRIANADITLICEAPAVAPHRQAMVANVAAMLGIEPFRVSVKATTNEKLGFIGRREGIAAIATATIVFPGNLP